MTEIILVKRALLSVSDKSGLIDLALALQANGVEILSTGGTYKLLKENKLEEAWMTLLAFNNG